MDRDASGIFERQGFGGALELSPPFGLLVVDCTVAFADPAFLGGGNIPAALPVMKTVLAHARAKSWPIAHTRMVFAADGSDANVFSDKIPGNLDMVPGSRLVEFVDDLMPARGELVVEKTLPSGFFGTTLASWLHRQGARTLVVIGATTSGCIRASVVDAMSHGFVPVVPRDCVGDRSEPQHEASLFDMQMKYAEIVDSATLLSIG